MVEFAEWLQATSISVAIQSTGWAIPLLQSIHILMIGIVFVSMLMIVLRIFDRIRTDQTFAEVWGRFAPWMWTGLVVMALTGVLLVLAEPVREFTSLSFWLKMALLVIGVAGVIRLGGTLRTAALGPETVISSATRSTAVALIVLWLAVIFLGRAIAYDVEVWGSLSLSAGL